MTETTQTVQKADIVVSRIIDAPIQKVWQAWTDPQAMMRWWGPQFYTSPSCKIDLRVGGAFVFAMQAPPEQGGQVSYTAGVYARVIPLERLEFSQHLSDANGIPLDPALVGLPADFPKEIRTSVVMKTRRDMTELTVTEYDWAFGQMYVYSQLGLHQSIDKLIQSLAEG
jgi:uncharacterized protein YndB with AHSA1/START domain